MNNEAHSGTDDDAREMAFALVDRTLTAIGGFEASDPLKALDLVIAMYERALARLQA